MKGKKRFEIDSLIRLANATENEELREELIATAIKILLTDEDTAEERSEYKWKQKMGIVFSDGKWVPRTELYQQYVWFCEENKLQPIGRHTFYLFCRENGAWERKINGYRYIRIGKKDES